MKLHSKLLLLSLLAFVSILNSGFGQGGDVFVVEPEPLKPNVSVEMQVVAIPRAAALPLVKALLEPANTDPAYEQIQQMLIAGTAKLIGWPTVTCHSGQRAVVECVEEARYATEFAGGGVDIYLTTDGEDFLKQDSKIKGIQLNAVPESFETRNLGVTLETSAVLSADGQTISVVVAAQNVRLIEMRKVTIEREPGPEKLTVEQPAFDTNKVTTSLTLKNGQRILLGSFADSEAPDHMELFLLKAEAKKE